MSAARGEQPSYAFIVAIADEGVVQLEACLGYLRAAYPDAPVRVISDGVVDPEYARCCKQHKCDYVEGAYLKRAECGGAWWRRTLAEGLATGAKWIVKLDPDARVWRKFKGEPKYPIAGTIGSSGTVLENVQGGCQAILAEAAQKILQSKLPEDESLRSCRKFAFDDITYMHWRAKAYLCSDRMLLWFARNLGIEHGDWPEIFSKWLPPAPLNDDRTYAVTHPHKFEPITTTSEAPLRVITTCKDRLHHLQETLPGWLAEPNVSVTVVDYDCPQGTADWVRKNHPEARVVHAKNAPGFNLARARNLGARHSPGGWWAFFDADFATKPGWSHDVRRALRNNRYLLGNPITWGQFGSVVVRSRDFYAAGGYDELFVAWGAEDGDFYNRLRHVGVRPGSFSTERFASIAHDDRARTAHYDVKTIERSRVVQEAYGERKLRFMREAGRLPRHDECRMLLIEVLLVFGFDDSSCFYPSIEEVDLIIVVLEEQIRTPHHHHAPASSKTASSSTKSEDSSKSTRTIRADAPASAGRPHFRVPSPPAAAPTAAAPVVAPPAPAPPAAAPSKPSGPPQAAPIAAAPTPPTPAPSAPSKAPAPSAAAAPLPTAPVEARKPPAGAAMPPAKPKPKSKPMDTISVVNHTTLPSLGIDPQRLVELGMEFLDHHEQHWPGTAARLILTDEILPHTQAIILMDDEAHDRALGYQYLTPHGLPLHKVLVKESLIKAIPVSETFTHTLSEKRVDPYVNQTATADDGQNYIKESCDPVEGDHWILSGHRVANFVTPGWFQPDRRPGSGRFDFMGQLSRAFELKPWGYAHVLERGQLVPLYGSIGKGEALAVHHPRRNRHDVRQGRHWRAATHAHPQYQAQRWA